jgi:heme-degrading monooxygenase HmoA
VIHTFFPGALFRTPLALAEDSFLDSRDVPLYHRTVRKSVFAIARSTEFPVTRCRDATFNQSSEEIKMFARTVTIRLKPESVAEFNRTLENNILPLLRSQQGFKEEITLANGTEVVGISLWDKRESAEAYQRTTYSQVQKLLSNLTSSTPQVQTYEVTLTTLQKAATGRGVSG